MKPTQSEVIKLEPEVLEEVRKVIRLMRIGDTPPDEHCTCTTCRVKTVLLGLAAMDKPAFEKISLEVLNKAGPRAAMTEKELEEDVTKYFDDVLQPTLLKILETRFGEQLPEGGKLHVGERIPEIDEEKIAGLLMKPAMA